jgi:hypothetical protein
MSGTPHTLEGDWASWVREHQVCWELAPVQEMVKGLKGLRVQQTGYALKLFGRFDPGAQDGAEAVARNIYERLRTLATEVIRSMPVPAIVQVAPPGRAVVPMESRLVMEVELTVVASPDRPGRPLPSGEVRRLIGLVEDSLRSMGLKKR